MIDKNNFLQESMREKQIKEKESIASDRFQTLSQEEKSEIERRACYSVAFPSKTIHEYIAKASPK